MSKAYQFLVNVPQIAKVGFQSFVARVADKYSNGLGVPLWLGRIRATSSRRNNLFELGSESTERWQRALAPDMPNWKLKVISSVAITLAVVLVDTTASAGSHCEPLLVTIEGGSASSGGQSIEDLYAQLDSLYFGSIVRIMNIDNKYFFTGGPIPTSREGQMDIFAGVLVNLGFWPIVIVGHSLGGSTAHDIASRVPISLLLLTFPK